MPAGVIRLTAANIRMDIATLLRVTVGSTTSTASATCTARPYTPTPRASTLKAPTTTDVAIIILAFAPITDTECNVIIDSPLIFDPTHAQEYMTIAPATATTIWTNMPN